MRFSPHDVDQPAGDGLAQRVDIADGRQQFDGQRRVRTADRVQQLRHVMFQVSALGHEQRGDVDRRVASATSSPMASASAGPEIQGMPVSPRDPCGSQQHGWRSRETAQPIPDRGTVAKRTSAE